jgi:hypothetical protein
LGAATTRKRRKNRASVTGFFAIAQIYVFATLAGIRHLLEYPFALICAFIDNRKKSKFKGIFQW